MSNDAVPMSPPQRPHRVMCPHCGKKQDLREWAELFTQNPKFSCEPDGCGGQFEIAAVETVQLVRTRPL